MKKILLCLSALTATGSAAFAWAALYKRTKWDWRRSTMAQYKLKVGKIGQSIIDTHKKIESATVGTYKSVENYVVDAYKAIETAFVDRFLEKVEDENNEQ